MMRPVMGARRSALEIIFEMLTACGDGGINKTAIMYRCSMSYDQLTRYLTRLCEQGLLGVDVNGLYWTTPRGQETLQQATRVIQTLQ